MYTNTGCLHILKTTVRMYTLQNHPTLSGICTGMQGITLYVESYGLRCPESVLVCRALPCM